MQIQVLLVAIRREIIGELNTGSNIKVAKLLVFSREAGKIGKFIIAYRLYLRIKMRDAAVEK